jgi:hypothetical protein
LDSEAPEDEEGFFCLKILEEGPKEKEKVEMK